MRHRRNTQNLSRFSSYFQATLRALARSVILHQSIVTTKVRAKLARRLVERLITFGKDADSIAARRRAYAVLGDHDLVKRLFSVIAPNFTEKTGGYTRIIPYKRRRGDNAELVILELSQKSEVPEKKVEEKPQDARVKAVTEKKKVQREQEAARHEAAPPEKTKHKQEAPQKPKKGIGGLGKLFKQQKKDS